MLQIDISKLKVRSISELSVGDLFLHGHGDSYAMCLVVPAVSEGPTWLYVSGPEAFRLMCLKSRAALSACDLGINASELKLRVDLSSASVGTGVHMAGQLVAPHGEPVSIAAVWPELAHEDLRNTIRLGDWSHDRAGDVHTVFDRWSLSQFDGAGQWVDVVRHGAAN